MSEDMFLKLLQSLLTMVDPEDPLSVASFQNVLNSVLAMGEKAKAVDGETRMLMMRAAKYPEDIIYNRKDFAGKPGDYKGNQAKRNRLYQALMPSC